MELTIEQQQILQSMFIEDFDSHFLGYGATTPLLNHTTNKFRVEFRGEVIGTHRMFLGLTEQLEPGIEGAVAVLVFDVNDESNPPEYEYVGHYDHATHAVIEDAKQEDLGWLEIIDKNQYLFSLVDDQATVQDEINICLLCHKHLVNGEPTLSMCKRHQQRAASS